MIRPLGDRVLVSKIGMERVRASGLIVPDSVREQSDRASVLEVGPGHVTSDGTLVPITNIKVGDVVVFSPYAGSQVLVDDEEFLLLKVGDVLGVIEDGEPSTE